MNIEFSIAVALLITIAISSSLAAQVRTLVAWTWLTSNMAGALGAQEQGCLEKNGVEVERVL